jgi:hypothetical protein
MFEGGNMSFNNVSFNEKSTTYYEKKDYVNEYNKNTKEKIMWKHISEGFDSMYIQIYEEKALKIYELFYKWLNEKNYIEQYKKADGEDPFFKLKGDVSRIVELSEEGKSLGLFVGRRSDQITPKNEGWMWISVDPYDKDEAESVDIEETETETETESKNGRMHLYYKVGKHESWVKKIQRLFKKVIVDFSTSKFLGDEHWKTLHSYLKKDKSSTLICETSTGVVCRSWEEYKSKGVDEIENEDDQVLEKNRTILQKLFHKVEILDLTNDPDLPDGQYFKATDPKDPTESSEN